MNTEHYRILGYIEGASLLLLLFIAMPLKYFFGYPEAVSLIGMIHGVLFTAYALFGFYLLEELRWSFGKFLLALLIASVPFGPFIFDAYLFPERDAEAC